VQQFKKDNQISRPGQNSMAAVHPDYFRHPVIVRQSFVTPSKKPSFFTAKPLPGCHLKVT
jgi:hypothetical protein